MTRFEVLLVALAVGGMIVFAPLVFAQDTAEEGNKQSKRDEPKQEEVTLATLNYDAPEIKKIEERINERYKTRLKKLLDDGKIGLNNKGYVELRAEVAEKLELKEKSEIKKIVEAENKDRDELIKTVAKVNNLAKEQGPLLQKAYIKAYREKALPGWWIQEDDKVLEDGTVQKGKWVQKKPPKEKSPPEPADKGK